MNSVLPGLSMKSLLGRHCKSRWSKSNSPPWSLLGRYCSGASSSSCTTVQRAQHGSPTWKVWSGFWRSGIRISYITGPIFLVTLYGPCHFANSLCSNVGSSNRTSSPASKPRVLAVQTYHRFYLAWDGFRSSRAMAVVLISCSLILRT